MVVKTSYGRHADVMRASHGHQGLCIRALLHQKACPCGGGAPLGRTRSNFCSSGAQATQDACLALHRWISIARQTCMRLGGSG